MPANSSQSSDGPRDSDGKAPPQRTAAKASGGEAVAPPGKRRRRQLTPDEQLEIVRRIQGGEMQSEIARELGYTRQRISAIMKKFEQVGADGFVHRKRGPKAGPVPLEKIEPLIAMLRDQSPADFGFGKKDPWTYEKAEAAGIQVWGRKPPKRYLRTAFKQAGVELRYDNDPDEDLFTPEFKAYLRSAKAQEIREREAEYQRRLEEQGLVNRPPRIGRPTKEDAARRAAPWQSASGAADGKPAEPTDGADAPVDEVDAEMPDWNNMSPEELKAFQNKHDLAPFLSGAGQGNPGERIGKHRKQKASGSARRRKRKGRKR